MAQVLHLSKEDNVVTALIYLNKGQVVESKGVAITTLYDIPEGHKLALGDISKKSPIIKFGQVIGYASKNIKQGDHVHVQNVVDPVTNWKEQNQLPTNESDPNATKRLSQT